VNSGLDTPSREQVGWRDLDGDNIFDPMDTTLAFTLNPFGPPTNDSTPTWTGTAGDTPYTSPYRSAVSINYPFVVLFRSDGGTWIPCIPSDGAYNSNSEGYTCTPATPLTDGPHMVETQAQYRSGALSPILNDMVIVDTTPPGNPTTVDTGCGAQNGIWQNFCADPAFVWSGAVDPDPGTGVAGYYYYWGPNAAGEPTTWTTTTAYDPPAVTSPSTYYLRIKTQDNVGNIGPANTVFTFRYETQPPSNATNANPSCTASHDTWQNTCADPSFTWSAGSDADSGVRGYHVYWGADPSGTPSQFVTGAAFDPPAVGPESTTYLRVQTEDWAGNLSSLDTLFIFKYDATVPDSSVTTITATVPNVAYLVSWAGTDGGVGGLSYTVQYRVGSGGAWTDWLVNTTQTSAAFGGGAPFLLTPGQTYYFRVRAQDQLGNLEAYPGGDGDRWVTVGYTVNLPTVVRLKD
jgi:hypothetical protein